MGLEDKVKTDFMVAADVLNPLLAEEFGEAKYVNLVAALFPMYYRFLELTNGGKAVIAKNEFLEPELLISADSLEPYKALLKKSKEKVIVRVTMEKGAYDTMLSASYSRAKITELEEMLASKEALLGRIAENAMAYYYWCLKNIVSGKRIGYVAYKFSLPDVYGSFNEMDMKKYFPNYGTHTFDERNFIKNSTPEEIFGRLIAWKTDFEKEFTHERRDSVLDKIAYRIRICSAAVGWDYSSWLREITGKESFS
jgi:hypothetical protein